MRIAQVSPLYESVPPLKYGGTERIVSFLTEELVSQGHEVTLFASGDSSTSATLRGACPQALWRDPATRDFTAPHVLLTEMVMKEARRFDIIHSHLEYLPFPAFRRLHVPVIHTMHSRLDVAELRSLYVEFSDAPLISISDSQRSPLGGANWLGTVYHGLPENLLLPGDGAGGYLAFLGRVSKDKGLHKAIEAAKQAGMPLKIAAKITEDGREFFETAIRPMLHDSSIQFVGEVDEAGKQEFLGKAAALLFPIEWPEPFGLVMIEAMACGTPVLAFRQGSVEEIVEPGLSGVICDDLEQMVEAVGRLAELDRKICRQCFERRFTARRMAESYLELYRASMFTGSGLRLVPGRAGGIKNGGAANR